MSSDFPPDPLGRVGTKQSVESGLPCVPDPKSQLTVAPQLPSDVEMLEEPSPVEASVERMFPGIGNGDFTEVESCLTSTESQEDLVAYLENADSNNSKLEACLARGSSQVEFGCLLAQTAVDDEAASSFDKQVPAVAGLFYLQEDAKQTSLMELGVCLAADCNAASEADLSNSSVDSACGMDVDDLDELLVVVKLVEEKSHKDQLSSARLAEPHSGLNLSPGTPEEAADHSAVPTRAAQSLPMLDILGGKQPQQSRSAICKPELNRFETMADSIAAENFSDAGNEEDSKEFAIGSVGPGPVSIRGRGKLPALGRRRTAGSSTDGDDDRRHPNDKSYYAVCQKNRIFDTGAKARYSIGLDLERDVIVSGIVEYVKRCLDPERDRVHRFLMVMLIDGQLRRGPYWRFFNDAVYFCDARKDRQTDKLGPMFHIRLSAYVGLLWGRYKGNECFDYATLGDAIKSVKSKPHGERYFVVPEFGHQLHGKPKRLFQFGPLAIDEIRRYRDQCVAEDARA